MTMNSPESLTELWKFATKTAGEEGEGVKVAELMREVGLKCISFNGVSYVYSVSCFYILCERRGCASLFSQFSPSLDSSHHQLPRRLSCKSTTRRCRRPLNHTDTVSHQPTTERVKRKKETPYQQQQTAMNAK